MTTSFTLQATDGRARAGELRTAHGTLLTPAFMPVGTQATVKSLIWDDVRAMGYNLVLCNNYHLYLNPGSEYIASMGGLHKFMNWDGMILTDSGGFQVFSMATLAKITDEGVHFKSHVDGSRHFFTPEIAIKSQEYLGSDIAMVLDQPVAPGATYEQTKEAMERTHRWAAECKRIHTREDQQLFAIVQGGFVPELRRISSETLAEMDFPGYAIGGLSVGEGKKTTWENLDACIRYMPEDKARYMMGVGSPEDLFYAIEQGVDMMDCVLATRIARNAALWTHDGRINIDRPIYKGKDEPIDPECDCYTCRTFSKAYVNHLFRNKELTAFRLASIHNLKFLKNIVTGARQAIFDNNFEKYKINFLERYQVVDEKVRLDQKRRYLERKSSDD